MIAAAPRTGAHRNRGPLLGLRRPRRALRGTLTGDSALAASTTTQVPTRLRQDRDRTTATASRRPGRDRPSRSVVESTVGVATPRRSLPHRPMGTHRENFSRRSRRTQSVPGRCLGSLPTISDREWTPSCDRCPGRGSTTARPASWDNCGPGRDATALVGSSGGRSRRRGGRRTNQIRSSSLCADAGARR